MKKILLAFLVLNAMNPATSMAEVSTGVGWKKSAVCSDDEGSYCRGIGHYPQDNDGYEFVLSCPLVNGACPSAYYCDLGTSEGDSNPQPGANSTSCAELEAHIGRNYVTPN